jgi:cytochrome c biogenesis protein CcmG, thiol:disulfide interchange protein DsbE
MRKARFLIPLVLLGCLVWFLGAGLKLDPKEVPSPLINRPAPEFNLSRLDDPQKRVQRSDMLGQVWILSVWASWCAACREEHPVLIRFAARNQVAIMGLDYKDERAAGQRWLSNFGNPYRASLFDEDGRVGIDWGVYGVPETFIIDKQGVVRFKHIGPLTDEVIQTEVEPLIRSLNG